MEYLEITDTQGRAARRAEAQPPARRPRAHLRRLPAAPQRLRRHAQIQRSPEGVWILQDLNSLNHVYVGDRPVQQIVLEGGKEVRIADYRLTLLEASTIIEPGKAAADNGEPWTSLGPAWIEQLHTFQRELLRYEQARQVLEKLAHEFSRIAQPQVVAVGTAHAPGARERYHWDVILCPEGECDETRLEEAIARTQTEDSEIQCWARASSDDRHARPGAAPVPAVPDEGPLRPHRPRLRLPARASRRCRPRCSATSACWSPTRGWFGTTCNWPSSHRRRSSSSRSCARRGRSRSACSRPRSTWTRA